MERKWTNPADEPRYGIKVTFTSGEEDDMEKHGNFASMEEAFEEICRLAGREMYEQNEEFEAGRTCSIKVDAYEGKLTIHYELEDKWRYYQVVEL